MNAKNLKREALELAEEILAHPESTAEILPASEDVIEVRIRGKRQEPEQKKAELKQL